MSYLARLALGVLLVGSLLGGAFAWLALPEIQEWSEGLQHEHQRGQLLDLLRQAQEEQLEAAERLALDLAEGRLTLPAAAGRYCDLYQPDPGFWEAIGTEVQGDSDEERAGNLLVRWAADALREDPHRAGVVVARLEAELEECLAAGTIYLPPAVGADR